MKSLKKHLIIGYSILPELDELKGNNISLITSSGVITGTPATIESKDNVVKLLLKTNKSITDNYYESNNLPDDYSLPDNDGYLTLSNAKLVSGNVTTNFQFITVFFDQIVGVTLSGPSN